MTHMLSQLVFPFPGGVSIEEMTKAELFGGVIEQEALVPLESLLLDNCRVLSSTSAVLHPVDFLKRCLVGEVSNSMEDWIDDVWFDAECAHGRFYVRFVDALNGTVHFAAGPRLVSRLVPPTEADLELLEGDMLFEGFRPGVLWRPPPGG